MNNFIEIKAFEGTRTYRSRNIYPKKFLALAEFLATDVGSLIMVKMAKQKLAVEGGDHNADACCAERKGDNIILWHQHIDIYPDLVIPYSKFAKLLGAWEQVLEDSAEEVTIKFDDDYNFELGYSRADSTFVSIKL